MTENEIILFKHEEFGEIRTLNINGEPWFVGKDVAEKLGYVEAAKAIRTHVDKEDKGVSVLDTPGGQRNLQQSMKAACTALSFQASCRVQKIQALGYRYRPPLFEKARRILHGGNLA